jgi:hypothetical protein
MFLELYLHHHRHDQCYIYAYRFWIMLSVTGSTSIPSIFIIDLGYGICNKIDIKKYNDGKDTSFDSMRPSSIEPNKFMTTTYDHMTLP